MVHIFEPSVPHVCPHSPWHILIATCHHSHQIDVINIIIIIITYEAVTLLSIFQTLFH